MTAAIKPLFPAHQIIVMNFNHPGKMYCISCPIWPAKNRS